MKRMFSILAALMLILSSAACGVSDADKAVAAASSGVTQTPDATQTPEIVSFSDPVLEVRIRKSMGKPEGTITVQEAEEVLSLDLSGVKYGGSSKDSSITDIDSLKYFKNVFRLDLSSNAIADIGALSELTGLRILDLSDNSISDLSPLAQLNLTDLSIGDNQVADVTPLSGITERELPTRSSMWNLGNMKSLSLSLMRPV